MSSDKELYTPLNQFWGSEEALLAIFRADKWGDYYSSLGELSTLGFKNK